MAQQMKVDHPFQMVKTNLLQTSDQCIIHHSDLSGTILVLLLLRQVKF
jgi:hypothetical protein